MQQRFLLQILLLAQHVSGTTMPIIRSSTPDQQLENQSTKYHRQQPLYNTPELLMMGIVVPETCWASSKICNKKPLLHLVGILFPHTKSLVSRFSPNVTSLDIKESLNEQLTLSSLVCARPKTKHSTYTSFHISVHEDNFPLTFWSRNFTFKF